MQDTAYHENTCQVRAGHNTYVMASPCNPAINIVHLTGDTNITVTLRALDDELETAHQLTGL